MPVEMQFCKTLPSEKKLLSYSYLFFPHIPSLPMSNSPKDTPRSKVLHTILVLLVFAVTGTTATIFPKWVIPDSLEKGSALYIVVYILLITPLYQVLLLGYAFLFGKFSYFWNKQKQLFNWLRGRKNQKSNSSSSAESSRSRPGPISTE